MPRDLHTYRRFCAWYAQRQRCADSWERLLQARRYAPIRRTGPAPQWHPDAYQQPGEVE